MADDTTTTDAATTTTDTTAADTTTTTTTAATTTGDTTTTQAAPEWLGSIGDEGLRANEHLSRYKSIDDLAKAHVETVNWARGRVPIPVPNDKDPAAFERTKADFIAKARPESPDGYTIPLPEGQTDTTRADAFKAKAHELGLMPWQAEALATWDNNALADAQSLMGQKAKDELKTREMNLGPAAFARGQEAIAAMFDGIEGVDRNEVLSGLESAYGAGAAFDFLLEQARKTGELDKVDDAAISMRLGTMKPAQAQAEIERLMTDAAFMTKAAQANTPEHARWNQLNSLAAGG